MRISQYRLAKEISVFPRGINEIVHGKRSITADTALRLGRFFGMTPLFWLNLQNRYDLKTTEDLLGNRLNKEVMRFRLIPSILIADNFMEKFIGQVRTGSIDYLGRNPMQKALVFGYPIHR